MLRAACLAAAVAAHAGSPAQPAAPAASAAATPLASGEVRKVDKDAGKLTLRHGPIQNLDMPAMTMVFRVAQPAMLDKLKEGDKLRFAVERVNGAFTVTHIELEK
ncbi:copper-binding protein [Aquabacterium sp.]|uniref:copper-binding protein n=1 Tax=Aquabacterium sp. TaxID=1872578 RepID=UPI002BB5A8FD|nr:copper-binding protein [Aquabacterium sp.]HSW08682.1 copper-binding protein [Aquabacterium sp.]